MNGYDFAESRIARIATPPACLPPIMNKLNVQDRVFIDSPLPTHQYCLGKLHSVRTVKRNSVNNNALNKSTGENKHYRVAPSK